MSGVTGDERIKSREDYDKIVCEYRKTLVHFKGFVNVYPSGSYNSNQKKNSFGDMDLITHIDGSLYNYDKKLIKKELVKYLLSYPVTVITPFSSIKYSGKRLYNSGEIVTVSYKTPYRDIPNSCQIDNIITMSKDEVEFKSSFLDMPAEKQGLILGLIKTAVIEQGINTITHRMGIGTLPKLTEVQEYEFNLSSVELQLRKVTYDGIGSFKQIDREVVWSSQNWWYVLTVLQEFKLQHSFDSLINQSLKILKHPRSLKRMVGVFTSMITVKSGEVGKKKGRDKEKAIAKVLVAFTPEKVGLISGRFQPITLAHYSIIKRMSQENDKGIVFLVKGKTTSTDKDKNPLGVGLQKKLLESILPKNVSIKVIETGFFIDELNEMKETDFTVYTGTDRVSSYERYKGYMTEGRTLTVQEINRTDADISASKVREALINGDKASFKSMTPPQIYEFYTELHTSMTS